MSERDALIDTRITRRHFVRMGIQAEVVKLNGAMELAPGLELYRRQIAQVLHRSPLLRREPIKVVGHPPSRRIR